MAQQTFEEIVAAVKQAESRGKRYAADGKTLTTSPKGALGEMQVMPKTITNPGFGVTPAKDKSPDEIARVGVDYLQAMKQKYGDTEKALIAYNWGPGSTDKWIAAGANPDKLPAETKTYVERVKGLLGKNVSRETQQAKTEPTPAEEIMTKALPAGTTAQAMPKDEVKTMAKMDVKSMPASYQAAFALAALADAQDEEDDRVYNENKGTETEKFFADYKPVNHLASLDLSVKPITFADGGDVDAEDLNKPFIGNPNITMQGNAARRNAAIQKASYRDEVAEAKDTARKGEAYQELERYLQSRNAVPDIKVTGYLPEGTHGLFSSDKTNVGTGTIKVNKNVSDMFMPSTIAHEMTHAADRQMMQQAKEQGMFGNGNQFTEAYEKMVGPEGRNRTQLLRKRYPEFEEDNRYYRADPKELAAHAIGAYSGPAMQDRAPRHVDATAATEFQILMDLAQRNVDKGPTGLAKIPAFFKRIGSYADGGDVEQERLTPQQIERIAAQETADREAASNAAFIAQKSGIGRKEGNISKALKSGEGQVEFAKGMTNIPQNILGAPMDISNMVASIYGGNVEKPFMGSEYLKEKSRAAGLGFTPSTDPTLAGFYGAGDLASNLVNPAGVTRAGVQAAGKTGEAAKMLAKDFQQYNQNLAVPGASYAIRNRGTPFLNTPAEINRNGKVTREAMGEADDYADWLSRTFAHGQPALKTWLRDKVGAYLRRDFGTESDQMVQAADQGKKLHFMSPKLTENVPHQLNEYIDISRELEGFPKSGFAKTPQGQKVEEVVDSTIYPLQLQDIGMTHKVPKSMTQFVGTNPEMRVSQMGPIDENLKFDELAQAMEKMFKEKEFRAYGESVPMPKDYILTEETLKGLTPAQASNRVANKMEWVDKKRAELAGVAISKDPQIVSKNYDNGSKWISPGDLANNPNHAEMVKDIGCSGGWCTDKDTFAMDYGSGENRLNILLDKKFEPRVQLTVNSPPVSVREFILANPHLPEIDAIAQNRTITSREVDRMIKAMPEYLDFVKQNQGVKRITEIKGQFNNADLRNSPYLKQVQDFVKRQGPDLLNVHNLEGINMVDARVELAKKNTENYMKKFKNGYIDKLRELNGNSFYVDEGELPGLLKKVDSFIPPNAARALQMNLFQSKATGGMIERQPNDNRRYL